MSDDFDHSQATVIFVLGLLGIVACQICGPIAFVMGNKYRAACAMEGVEPEGLATAGWIMGIISSILFCLTLALVALYIVFIVVIIAAGGM
jgi:uncharacterized membrane protein YjgN (DUF898 family)